MKKFVWPKSVLIMAVVVPLVTAYAYWRTFYGPNYLTLRTSVEWDGDKTTRAAWPRVWKLVVPKDFIVRTVDWASWRVFAPVLGGGNAQSFYDIRARIDRNNRIAPSIPLELRKVSDAFPIQVLNDLVLSRQSQVQYCIPNTEAVEIRTSGSIKESCSSEACAVEMNFHGWRVLFWNPQSRGIPVQEACRIVRGSLDLWTTSIDDLRKQAVD